MVANGTSAMNVPGRVVLPGHVPAAAAHLSPDGVLPVNDRLSLSIGLPLRNTAELEKLLAELYDPASPNFHKYLSSQEFTARFGPTELDYAGVKAFAQANGLSIAGTYSNRMVLEVEGSVSNIERAFGITLNTYRHPTENRDFFAPNTEPSVPTNLPVADMWGLSDFSRPQPMAHRAAPLTGTPLNYNGTGPGGSYRGADFRNAYASGSSLVGAGQTVAVVEFDGYYSNDITSYEAQCGYASVPLQNILLNNVSGTPGYSGVSNAVVEVSLDIELAIAMAPGLSMLTVYEGNSPYTVFNQIATDNTARQVSCSWSWKYGPAKNWSAGKPGSSTLDFILSQMVAQGQAFFQASGDSDAYTGSQALSSSSGPIPVDSIYVTSVGGTTLTMSGSGSAWSSETVWNWGNNVGSSGGISPNYSIPSWQASVSMAANSGSTINRNIPDVAMTADAVYVIYNNGSSGYFGGTSCAAPLWAGYCALVNQQAAATSGMTVGFLNPALYAIAAGNNYTNCFHDTTTGNNIGSNTPGLFYAVTNYDLVTGLGTPNGVNLINALAPPTIPYFISQPSSQTAINGANVTFSGSAGGQLPLVYRWLFNGSNLPAGGNVSGTASNVLTLSSVTSANAGNYSVIVTNSYGSATSSVATLTVTLPPSFTLQPTNQSVLAGNPAALSTTVNGASPLFFQWRQNGTNLVNGGNVSGATSNVLAFDSVAATNAGNYTLFVTNIYGAATSSAAALTVLLPPVITTPPAAQSIQCGSNASFNVVASGTAPLRYRWSTNNVLVASATNTSLSLTNVHLPGYAVAVIVTSLYGSATSSVPLTVQDTLGPIISLNSTNPYYVELGGTFTDPAATASDLCAGIVPVTTSGTVNTSVVSTNTVTYTATDGNGNTNLATRTVIVRDTTPPAISWSFSNLVLAADSNCAAVMPDVTGTNYILATDLSGTLTITQSPTTNAGLSVGTNIVVITVADAADNKAYSTNRIAVQDQTPPVILGQPQSQTNTVGGNAGFSLAATACTPLAFQWYFTGTALAAETNSSLTLSNLTQAAAGNYFAIATAAGGSSTSLVATLTVNLLSSTVALASSANPSGFKDGLNFTASITPTNAAGAIQFFTNGTAFDLEALANGVAVSTNLSTLPRGSNLVTAVYSGDANDLPSTNMLAQVITNHPPVAVPAFYTLATNFTLTISVADLATNWSDVDDDVISLADVSVSTNGIALTNTGTALIYFNSNNVADQFTCTLTDGWGGTNFQTVFIAPALSPDTTPIINGLIAAGTGGVTLSLGGTAGYTYILETTSNLSVAGGWLSLATNTLDTNGFWQFTDSDATNFTQRFYRLQLAP